MFKFREISHILATSLILAFLITLMKNLEAFIYVLISVLLIILINIFAKKLVANYMESEIEAKLWEIERPGLLGVFFKGKSDMHPSKKFNVPFPAGILIPLFSKLIFLPINNFIWMASLIFDVKIKISKVAKKHTLFSFSEITEYQIGLIAASGIIANLIFAVIGYLIELPPQMDFARLSLFYCFFNMLPFSNLDGNKIYFGNLVMWYTLMTFSLIGLGYAFFLVY